MSNLPPMWKIRRELRRFRPDILFPKLFFRYLSTRYYDLVLSRRKRIHQGNLDSFHTKRVAVYLLFPTSGVQGSHLTALDYMIRSGYSPVIVSNHYLDDRGRSKLLDRCCHLIERPNFGYDFGGYRDGILHLAPRIHELERLVLLNDSCWFPVPRHADWLNAAERLGTDLAGTLQIGYRVKSDSAVSDSGERIVYPSFALLYSRRPLADPEFLQFWRRLPLSNRKSETVKRGELGCSRWIFDNGYSHGSTYRTSQLDQDLGDFSSGELLRFLQSISPSELNEDADLARSILISEFADNPHWRRKATTLVLAQVSKTGFPICTLDQFARLQAFGFLKKRPMRSLPRDDGAGEVAEVIARFGLSCDFNLRAEISGLK